MTKYHPKNSIMAVFPDGKPSLEDVSLMIEQDQSLSTTRRRDLVSALVRLAHALGLPPSGAPADQRWLQQRIRAVSPAALGIAKKTWANIVSNAFSALKHVDLADRPFLRMNLNEHWQPLWDRLTVQHHRIALGRFMRFCAHRNVAPSKVTDTHVRQFKEVMQLASLRRRPDLAIYYLTTAWNKAADVIKGWPDRKLKVPIRRVLLAPDREELPPTFAADLDSYLEQMRDLDPLAETRPNRCLAPATIEHRDIVIRRFFGDLVRSGVPAHEITSLSVLVQPNNVRRGLRVGLDRRAGKVSGTIHILAIILKGIAKHYAQLTPAELVELDAICQRLKGSLPATRGMTEKNRARLRQMDDKQNVQALLSLPADLLREARTSSLSLERAAKRVEISLAIELELMTALRIKNLANLHIDRHFLKSRATREGVCHLVIPGEEVKNGLPLEFELTLATHDLYQRYIRDYRPHLAPTSCRWLFASRDGRRPVDPVILARRIKNTIREKTGLTVNPHLFRSIGAKLYLDRHPGGYEVVRRMLGHKAMATTIAAYTGLEGIAAAKHFDQTILDLRKHSTGQRRRKRRERR